MLRTWCKWSEFWTGLKVYSVCLCEAAANSFRGETRWFFVFIFIDAYNMAQGCHSWTLNSNINEILLSIDATVELSEASLVDSCSLLGNPVVTGWKTHIKCTFSNFFCWKFRSFFFDCCCQCSMWRVFFVVWVLMWFAYKTGFYNEGKNLQSLYRNLISIYIVHLSFLAFLHFTHYKYPLLRHAPKEIISKF